MTKLEELDTSLNCKLNADLGAGVRHNGDLQDDECWAQGAMRVVCIVLVCLLAVCVTRMMFMQVGVEESLHNSEKQRSLTCPMNMP